MQKSKDITKYNVHWQVVRVQAKKYKDVDSKLNYVLNFYKAHKTLDNHERIMNWIEGLAMGYKDLSTKAKINSYKELFDKSNIKEPIIKVDQIQDQAYKDSKLYNTIVIKECFNDNYNRFKKWASEAYYFNTPCSRGRRVTRLFTWRLERESRSVFTPAL